MKYAVLAEMGGEVYFLSERKVEDRNATVRFSKSLENAMLFYDSDAAEGVANAIMYEIADSGVDVRIEVVEIESD